MRIALLPYPPSPASPIEYRYDGKEIGAYQGDAIRNYTGVLTPIKYNGVSASGVFQTTANETNNIGINPGDVMGSNGISFDPSRVVPTAHENRPVSISALACITY